jgi:hypothetical protein
MHHRKLCREIVERRFPLLFLLLDGDGPKVTGIGAVASGVAANFAVCDDQGVEAGGSFVRCCFSSFQHQSSKPLLAHVLEDPRVIHHVSCRRQIHCSSIGCVFISSLLRSNPALTDMVHR